MFQCILYNDHWRKLSLVMRETVIQGGSELSILLCKIFDFDKSHELFCVYVTRDLCIFMKEVGWNPDRPVMNENSIYNGTRMSKAVLLYKCFVHRYYLGVQKVQQSHLQKKK